MRRLAALLLLASATPTGAQEPGPIVRARVEPGAGVMVGEPAHVVVDVLTPTWFLAPPQFPVLEVADAVVLLQERGINLNEAINGTTYSGLQRDYLVVPMREGRFTVPPIQVTVVWAIDARPSPPTALSTRTLSFEATIPAAARGLDHFVSARRLELRQVLEPRPEGLTVGGALRRTVTIEGEGTFGMMLPPLPVPAIDGLAAYADPPQVEDRAGERSEARVARRIESVSYRLEREGDYELPAVEVAWWDTGARRMRKASLPAVPFSVAPAPARADEIPLPAEEGAAAGAAPESPGKRWASVIPWLASVVVGVVLLAWLLPLFARSLRRFGAGLEAARLRHLDSEPAWFARLRRAAATSDARATYLALLGWTQRCGPAGFATIGRFATAVGDAEFGAEIDRLGEALYGGGPAATAWTGDHLAARLGAARRRALQGHAAARPGLGPLNPGAELTRGGGPTTSAAVPKRAS